MNFEEYWEQTRENWEQRVLDPLYSVGLCGFCWFDKVLRGIFSGGKVCEFCPVARVYGGYFCHMVVPVQAFNARYDACADMEELRSLAEAVIQELDDKKAELIVAMRELWEEANAGYQA